MKPARDTADLLRVLVESTAGETGLPFFRALVQGLCESLPTHAAWVTEYLPGPQRLRALAFRAGNGWIEHYEYDLRGTPCETVIHRGDLVVIPDQVVQLYPSDPDLPPLEAVSYMGVPLYDEEGRLLGHLGALDNRAIIETAARSSVFRIFANRAGAELRRLNLEKQLRAKSEELDAVVESAMDAILILDDERTIVRGNRAAADALGTAALAGCFIEKFLSVSGAGKLEPILDSLAAEESGPTKIWIPGGFQARSLSGEQFAAEGTLSRFTLGGRSFFTLILRNIDARIEAERTISSLLQRTAYLSEEIERHFGEIIGESPVMRRLLRQIQEVADTGASVLIQGETGAGKELVARALHRASRRAAQPLIKINCAAIPAQLIESEFFGHEKGSFTGATARREGRFALADGGTLFLDEIGELPLELQSKLLRVLQEGEFEPVGSSRSRKVDVRVVAASNRDLQEEVNQGRFRQDLFYRLNVFPLSVPPLRERGDDVLLLTREFLRRFTSRDGRSHPQLTSRHTSLLLAHPWPGNVRELANVVERALILGRGSLALEEALPPRTVPAASPPFAAPDMALSGISSKSKRILTALEMRELEVANLQAALESCRGRVSGPGGAAELLGIKPTTLSSRLKALGLR
ncbi:MAG TPA: sigma-54-dependent Fis family transcriptional regulator [Verrucomicrobiales bacterium]|nr:sigma-54-dependent Fis family transcriptional regulator [Verrucomicrobiales bacterium]